jgi:uncharacterized protein (DUF952 family)
VIYHITTKTEWGLAKTAGIYEPESLQTEGFIHCVGADRFAQVANFYFKGRTSLVVLEINEEQISPSELRWEEVGSYTFPHIYGPLIASAVERVADLLPDANGTFHFPFQQVLH